MGLAPKIKIFTLYFALKPPSTIILVPVIFFDSSETPTGQVISDSTGIWHWSPTANLSLGAHVITVKVQDNISKTWTQVSHNFTVLASDVSNQPQYEASSSA